LFSVTLLKVINSQHSSRPALINGDNPYRNICNTSTPTPGLSNAQGRALKAKGVSVVTDLELELETLEEKHKRVTGMLEALAEDEQGGVDLEDGGLLLLNVDGSVNSQGVKMLFDRFDEDGNGYIDMAEVDTMCSRVHRLQQREQRGHIEADSGKLMHLLFELDADGDGHITEEELEVGLQRWVNEMLGHKEEEEEVEVEVEHDDVDMHLEQILAKMVTSVGSIEELTQQLDPAFAPDPALLAPHPYTLSITELTDAELQEREEHRIYKGAEDSGATAVAHASAPTAPANLGEAAARGAQVTEVSEVAI